MKPVGTNILNLGRAIALPLVGLALATPAVAQDDEPLLEEIVVVAQKREQNIMDVPVAITAVTGAQIEASGIKDVFDLQQNVPGLIVGRSQTATTSNFAIRGIGSTSNNFGVESSVGLYVDGVYRSRQSSMINELIDVYAAEVLRGPQGTLFGKNTASGAINIRTVAPLFALRCSAHNAMGTSTTTHTISAHHSSV
jgi:outer membrane receptor protein involved in Fe transport